MQDRIILYLRPIRFRALYSKICSGTICFIGEMISEAAEAIRSRRFLTNRPSKDPVLISLNLDIQSSVN